MIESITSRGGLNARNPRVVEIFDEHQGIVYRRTDRMFAVLMSLQWLAGVAAALWISPKAWEGSDSHTHPHVWAAGFLGAVISSLPIALALIRPGHVATRYAVAVGQMLMGALLIHLTGGRIETHFHVFGSLAFLSFYRDWRVLVPATVVVAADHFLRGVFWPQSVYGVLAASEWRWLEHAGWVIFEDVVLTWSCHVSCREMHNICEQQYRYQELLDGMESRVLERTQDLKLEMAVRERAEASLRESEERFRTLVENAPVGIYRNTADGRIDMVNPALVSMLGMTSEEELKQTYSGYAAN